MSKLTTLDQLKLLAERTKAELDTTNSKIQDIVTAGGEPNKIESIKGNGVALDLANKIVDILIATGSTNGTLSVAGVDVAVKGLAALAYKSEVTEAELSAALKDAIDAKAAQTDVDALSEQITTLVGDDAGKSARTIANEELAKQLIPENADASRDTLEEVAAWIQNHPNDAAAMNKAISDLTALVGNLPEGATSATVVAYIAEAIGNALADYYTKTEIDAMVASDADVSTMLTEVFG